MDLKKETFVPDWVQLWTKEKAEKELFDFTFQGPGWYITKSGTCLVQETNEGNKLRFYFWLHNPCETFNWIVNAPVKRDDR